jgi:hypothetical protein
LFAGDQTSGHRRERIVTSKQSEQTNQLMPFDASLGSRGGRVGVAWGPVWLLRSWRSRQLDWVVTANPPIICDMAKASSFRLRVHSTYLQPLHVYIPWPNLSGEKHMCMPKLLTNSPKVVSKLLHSSKMPAFTLYGFPGSTNTDRVRLTRRRWLYGLRTRASQPAKGGTKGR